MHTSDSKCHIHLLLKTVSSVFIITFVDFSSKLFSLGSTTECSCTYVHVLVTPMICRKKGQTLEYTWEKKSPLRFDILPYFFNRQHQRQYSTKIDESCSPKTGQIWARVKNPAWMSVTIWLTALAMEGRPHSVLSSLVLCKRPCESTVLSRTSTPKTLGFMGLGYFCMAALVTVSHGWLRDKKNNPTLEFSQHNKLLD